MYLKDIEKDLKKLKRLEFLQKLQIAAVSFVIGMIFGYTWCWMAFKGI